MHSEKKRKKWNIDFFLQKVEMWNIDFFSFTMSIIALLHIKVSGATDNLCLLLMLTKLLALFNQPLPYQSEPELLRASLGTQSVNEIFFEVVGELKY